MIDLFDEAEQKSSTCSEQLLQLYPDYFERLWRGFELVSVALPESEPISQEKAPTTVNFHQETSPSLAELQSLLLACRTLTALEQLKQHHSPQRVKQAYQSLSFEQQLPLDGIEALAVPQEVFKYAGSIQTTPEGLTLEPGCLVTLDPHTPPSDTTVWVWLLDGQQQGQCQPISLIKNCLIAVPPANMRE